MARVARRRPSASLRRARAAPRFRRVDAASRRGRGRALSGDRQPPDSVRLDVWLHVACVFPTRTRAKAACDGGKVDVNGARAKPHREVRVGDELIVTTEAGARRELRIAGLAERSIPKAQARALYEDRTPAPSPEAREIRRLDRMMSPPRDESRPDARERRERRRWKEGK
ncbi:MAG TPA: S4 domain-containing protein [Thermoanaerobaculia bacterium]